jgi:hypothetical protein
MKESSIFRIFGFAWFENDDKITNCFTKVVTLSLKTYEYHKLYIEYFLRWKVVKNIFQE